MQALERPAEHPVEAMHLAEHQVGNLEGGCVEFQGEERVCLRQ